MVDPASIRISSVKCYTDSTGCLGQLFSSDKQPVFVSNRIRKIRNSPIPTHWFHVPGELNPADCASRGISTSNFLEHLLWLHGPPFLLTGELPPQPYDQSLVSLAVTLDPGLSYVNDHLNRLIENTSSYMKMKLLMAYWVRYISIVKVKMTHASTKTNATVRTPIPVLSSKLFPTITPKDLKQALVPLVKCFQSVSFYNEIQLCKSEKVLKCSLKSLSPFRDSNEILRVGGRLTQSELRFGQNHPIILPKYHLKPTPTQKVSNHFILAIARHFHEANLHAGPKLLLSLLRSEFWIIRGQDLCNRVFRHCVKCFKAKPNQLTQLMGQLPTARVVPGFPFMKVGLDYAGPIEIATTPGRKPKLMKAYVCIFVCMVTKAIHLEFVGGLTTPDFISALHRFCSIRNTPSDIFCDGGRNFLGAKNELEALQAVLTNAQHKKRVALFCAGENIQFHFSPHYGPHHGGLWEAGVKSMKQHLARVTQGHHLSIEEFITLLARISAALNSRPLTPLSNQPDDFEVLTPFHFITLRAPRYVTEEDVTTTKGHRSRWHLVQQMFQHLSRRWTRDYLQTLQQRGKWLQPRPNVTKGTLVLVHDQDADSTMGPLKWQLGRVEETFPGKDGLVRACDIRIPIPDPDNKKSKKFKTLRRPIVRLSPLPFDDEITSAYSYKNTSNDKC